jgi:hypothetical protein
MKRIAFAIAGLLTLGAGSALAQYAPRPVMPIGPMPAEGVFEMVRQMGLQPIGRPVRNGPVFIQRAADYYGKPLRITIDARRAQVVSVDPAGGPPMLHGGPYASAGAPYYRRPHGPYGAMPMDDDDDFGPPGAMVGAPAYPGLPPQAIPPQKPKAKSAAVTPQYPPAPRRRPSSAPQEAVGSVEPIAPAPQQAPAAPAAAPEAKPATPEMTPVAPLN